MERLLTDVRAVLATTPSRWFTLTQTIPADLLTRAPAPNEWSAVECLLHLIDTERAVFPPRVRAFLAGEDFPAFDPASEGTRPAPDTRPADLAAHFARYRNESLALLERLIEADLRRSVRHAELGPVSLREMLHEWAAHDLAHTVQAERAIMQPFIVGSGPWRRFFLDHDLGSRS